MAVRCPACATGNDDTAVFCSACGTRIGISEEAPRSATRTLLTPLKTLELGSIFSGRYEILENVGKGGMGEVYRARDMQIEEDVAIKIIKPEISSDKETLERFNNELKLARKIAHKNVCRMFHLDKAGDTPYITMEYIEGEDLKSLIREKGKIPENATISIAKQICEGLAAAHDLGIIHRDLKPQNIMIDKKNIVKIMDFGIARFQEAQGVTQPGVMIGTPDYMSPEQAEGEAADASSDIYALGVMLFEMATGKLPFEGKTAFSVAMKHKTEKPAHPQTINPEISVNLCRLILTCMEKDRNRRYKTAPELFADLVNLEKGTPTIVPIGADKRQGSVVVLPFLDLSAQKDQEYFCEGLADELISSLTQLKNLHVVARTSAFSFKGKALDINEIGTKLNVDTVLEGSVRRAGNRLRITVQLIDVSDGYPIWSGRYDKDLEDIFAVQDDIAQSIVKALKIEVLGEKEATIVKARTENTDVYEACLKGRFCVYKLTPESIHQGLEYFQLALEKDPNFAPAYTGISFSWVVLGLFGIVTPREASAKAKDAALKAIMMDNTLAEAHHMLAIVGWNLDWEWKKAERAVQRAIETNPNFADAYLSYGNQLDAMGRHAEAADKIKRALELDPLNPLCQSILGGHLLFTRQYDEAIEQYRRTLKIEPGNTMVHNGLWAAFHHKDMFEDAFEEMKKYFSALGDTEAVEILDEVYAEGGYFKAMESLADKLEERSKKSYVQPTRIADLYAYAGKHDKALDWLEKAFEDRAPSLQYLKVEPGYDGLRDNPRFQAIVKKMNFP